MKMKKSLSQSSRISKELDRFSNKEMGDFAIFIDIILDQFKYQNSGLLVGIEVSKMTLEQKGFTGNKRKWVIKSLNEIIGGTILNEVSNIHPSIKSLIKGDNPSGSYRGISEEDKNVVTFGLTPIGLETLKEVRDEIFKRESKKLKKKDNISNEIRVLTLVEFPGNNKIIIVINEEYQADAIEVDTIKRSWKMLLDVATNGVVDLGKYRKYNIDFINFNKGCVLYSHSGYQPTKILKKDDEYIECAIEKIEAISKTTYEKRRSKALRGA